MTVAAIGSAELHAALDLVLATHRYEARVVRLATHLYGGGPDTARTGVQQHSLALGQLGFLIEVEIRRRKNLRQCRTLDDRDTVGNLEYLTCRCHHTFCIATAREQRAHRISGRYALHAFANFGDHARTLEPEYRACAGGRWIGPLCLHEIGAVDGAGGNVDLDFADTDLRFRCIRPL